MIDFTKAIEELNNYKGSEKKKTLIYENKKYLVKFPDPIREKNKNISYINNAFSELPDINDELKTSKQSLIFDLERLEAKHERQALILKLK